jgi:2-polyprenyl-3-methyl-5-hydroxy-6-metoxy-1,4-benzoquinol methylase
MHHYRLHQDPRSSHQQITRIVRELRRSPVLDVGAAQGILGQNLAGSGIEIDGIEPNPAWAEAARPHYRSVFVSPIECVSTLPPRTYAVVVCGDVLEHVVDPIAALRKLRAAATEDATFVISLPNVAHLAVRTMLLFGCFPRMQRGILDKTHLHFFTRKTAIQMLEEAGLRVERVSATPVPLDELWKSGEGTILFRVMMRVQHVFVALLPRLFGYQWIFVARPLPDRRS